MENAPILAIMSRRTLPEFEERWLNWCYTVYFPFLVKIPQIRRINTYRILKEHPDYNSTMTTMHYENISDVYTIRSNPEYIAWLKDINTTWTNRGENVWSIRYELIRSFNKIAAKVNESHEESVAGNPVMKMEAYRITKNEEEKFLAWFMTRGYGVYIPLILKLDGLIEFSLYKLWEPMSAAFLSGTGGPSTIKAVTEVEYPKYLSVLTFENPQAYENYEKSIELSAFREALKIPFPDGLRFHWQVAYQLLQSFTK